jgi:hypothetical protein
MILRPPGIVEIDQFAAKQQKSPPKWNDVGRHYSPRQRRGSIRRCLT